MNSFKEWILHDKYNILLTILCAIISLLPTLFSINFLQSENINKELISAIPQFIISIVGFLFTLFRHKPEVLNEMSKRRDIIDYIESRCNIKITTTNNAEQAYNVVKGTTNQFYFAWSLIWLIWILYYFVEIIVNLSWEDHTSFYFVYLENYLDFFSSVIMLGIYIVLNNITVDITNRAGSGYNDLIMVMAVCIFLFIVLCVLHLFAASNSCIDKYIKLEHFHPASSDCTNEYIKLSHFCFASCRCTDGYIKLLLGFFSTMSFILTLARLTSSYLNIPKVIIYLLYVYALFQSYTFLPDILGQEYPNISNLIDKCTPFVLIIGKALLLVMLSILTYKHKLIFFIIHRSLQIKRIPTEIKVFNRYLNN